MARMIPSNLKIEDFNDSVGERRIYSALSSLPDRYIIFHSVRWNKKQECIPMDVLKKKEQKKEE